MIEFMLQYKTQYKTSGKAFYWIFQSYHTINNPIFMCKKYFIIESKTILSRQEMYPKLKLKGMGKCLE